MASRHEERRVIIVGKTGNGKSSTGNTILGTQLFEANKGLEAVTSTCSVQTSIPPDGTLKFKVCDTPGFFDVDSNIAERMAEVLRSVTELCPDPHAFLLVFNGANRITEEEKYMIDLLRVTFGELVFGHCILVFTRGVEFNNDKEFEQVWNNCELFTKLAAKCGNRVVRIENKPKNGESGLNNLLTMIEEACNNGSKTYKYVEIKKHAEGLTKVKRYFDRKTKLWSNLFNMTEMKEFEAKQIADPMAFLTFMDQILSKILPGNVWSAGLYTTMALLQCGVKTSSAYVAGTMVAVATIIAGKVIEKFESNGKNRLL